mgnify:CR=1 FL=1|jgi:recombinase, phage RecT family
MAAQAQASNAVAKIEPRAAGVVGDVQRMEKQFALALPEHVSPEKFVRVVMTAINTNPDLQKADRQSVLAAAMKCAQDGLLPDGREAALVTYGNKAQYLPMIAGVLAKVRRSGELRTISAHIVYENDAFTYTLGDDERIEHQPRLDGPRGKPIAAYAIAKTKDGGVYREVMSVEQINQVRNVSRAKNAGPWVQWWDEMARKTVLRRLSKRLPMSTDLVQLFQRDDDHYDLSQAAQGVATMRRLHADFDEPHDEIPAAEVTDVTDEAPKDDQAAVAELGANAAEDFPGEHSAFDPATWADEVVANLDAFEDLDALNAFTDEPANIERFEHLSRVDTARARSLEAAINGRRKALASREQA